MTKPFDPDDRSVDDALAVIRRAISGLRYGEVLIAIHDGEIVQISRTEKIRTPKSR
ncbi:MAG TPA: YezD family protein [Kofleriaceae bacterium]|nr:YezD family protein [Kofleriaceae bacterium]